MNAQDFCFLIDSYIQKHGTRWVEENLLMPGYDPNFPGFRYISSGIDRHVYRFEDFVVKYGYPAANEEEFKCLKLFGSYKRIAHHFPKAHYLSKDNRLLIVDFVDGVLQTKLRSRSPLKDGHNEANTRKFKRMLIAAGVNKRLVEKFTIRDLHASNIIIKNGKRVFIDFGHCYVPENF